MEKMKKKIQYLKKGFTLLEMLLVVAIIAILATIVITAINPTKQLGAANDAKRWSDINTISNAMYQYAIDHNGSLPYAIISDDTCSSSSATSEICATGATSCAGLTDLSSTTVNKTYLTSIPTDPSGPASPHTGYFIVKRSNGRVGVCAPSAATGTISTLPVSAPSYVLPTITAQPESGDGLTSCDPYIGCGNFSVSVSGGTLPITYQWQWQRIYDPGWKNATTDYVLNSGVGGSPMGFGVSSVSSTTYGFTVDAFAPDDDYQFRVVISNPAGTITSEPGNLTLAPPVP